MFAYCCCAMLRHTGRGRFGLTLFACLAAAVSGQRVPALRLGATGAFPGLARPRVLWVGAEERDGSGRGGAGHLERCRTAVVHALLAGGIDLGEELARPFRPHVTVARPRGDRATVPEAFRALDFGLDWEPREVVLYESVPAPGGRFRTSLNDPSASIRTGSLLTERSTSGSVRPSSTTRPLAKT